ncbi:MAG: ComEC/Rec2 family competence protein [Chloroflexota bacterium]
MPGAVVVAIGAALAALSIGALGPPAVCLAGAGLVLAGVGTRLAHEQPRASRPAERATHRPLLDRLRLLPLGLGILAVAVRGLFMPAAGPAPALPEGAGPWTAVVESVGAPREGTRPAVLAIESPDLRIAATLPWYPPVVPGDRIETTGSLRVAPEGDYAVYLRRIGAAGTLRAASVTVLPAPDGPLRWLEGLRRGAAAALERAIPEPEAGLAAGILVGLRDRVDRQLAADFTTAGVSHVVAISGWNIAIVATCLGALAGSLGRRRRSILTGAAIVAYVLFVGPSPSVVRAGVMAGFVLLARELGRPSRAAAAMGWAVCGLLLVDPGWIDDAGFRLSVLATAGLMAWGNRMTAWLSGPAPGRVRSWLAESLGVSLAAQAATLPVILLEFGRLSLIAPAVNLVVVPLVAPAMAAGALALAAGALSMVGLPAVVATVGGLPAWAMLGSIVGAVRVGAGVPLASVTLDPPFDTVAAGVSVLAIGLGHRFGHRLGGAPWAFLRSLLQRPGAAAGHDQTRRPVGRPEAGRPIARRRHSSRAAAIALTAALVGLGLVVAHRPDGVARVVVLDVGQGDGILIEGGRGGRMLVDGGPDPGRLLVALDERLPPWDRRIDVVVLTHPHEDHVAGLALLLARYRVGFVYEPGMVGPGPGYAAWVQALGGGSVRHGTLSTGDRLAIDDVRLTVLWPDPGHVPERPGDGGTAINNVSIVLLGQVGARRFLLAGDIEEGIDPVLLARGLPSVDFLKVAHHGSRTASTAAFLGAVRPRVAVVSAGAGNRYGHPAPATIERLKEVARQTFRTDLDGTVEARFDGDVLRVSASGARRAATVPPAMAGAITAAGPAPNHSAAAARQAAESAAAFAFACGIAVRQGAAETRVVVRSLSIPEPPPPPWVELATRERLARTGAPGVVGAEFIGGRAGARSIPRRPASVWPDRSPTRPSGTPADLLYHRPDDGPFAVGGGLAPPLPRPAGVARAALARRRRGRGLARGGRATGGTTGRPPSDRGGRAPP